ncbi:GDSL esterase/lipase At1g29660-like [Hibiscus syriacus]|uniref:GDSL esterase/lipase At1g29660-like n=1 Tax=Hibiscus syriacus TaxID=106335 RepID=UPI001920FA5C|nr:GDSL esterase/lipase At1g29660-like [Hibiscus syriacus]
MDSNLKLSKLMAISVLLVLLRLRSWANAKPEVPCFFIFGDSFSDNGNNNDLKTLAKVDYPPYGNDFPLGPTGRFTNGRNLQDFIVELLGFKNYIPSFSEVKETGKNILRGVNYASGSAGILDETGKYNGARIPLTQQIIQNHKIIIQDITKGMQNDLPAAKKLLNKCIYSIQVGSNDYINNYFIPKFYDTSRRYSLSAFTDLLIQQLSNQIKVLYDNSARKFAVYGLPPIGCTPNAISLYGTTNGSPCVDKLNQAAVIFNEKLTPLIYQLNNNLTHAKFTYLNPSGSPIDPAEIVKNGTCCKTGGGAGELCIRNSKPCSNPKKHIFWDGVHLTEDQMQVMANNAYSCSSPVCANPFNLHKLAML